MNGGERTNRNLWRMFTSPSMQVNDPQRFPIMMHLHCNSDTSAAHWHDTVRRRANFPTAACFSTGPAYGATLPLRIRAARRTWASGRSYRRPGPATSWPAGGALRRRLRGQRRTSDISQQGNVQAEIRNKILIPCRTLVEHQHSWSSGLDSLAVCMRFKVRIQHTCTFCQNVFYVHILAYTVISRRILVYTCIY
jgi:hypothetical protein